MHFVSSRSCLLTIIIWLFAAVLLFKSSAASSAATTRGGRGLDYQYVVTPWCSNSFRIQIASTAPSDANIQEAARLRSILRNHGLSESLPGALIDDCGPGAPVTPSPGSPSIITNGNLGVQLLANGTSLLFTLRDTGETLLTVTSSLADPTFATGCSVGNARSSHELLRANMTLAAAQDTCTSTPECTAFSAQLSKGCTGTPFDNTVVIPVILVANSTTTNGDTTWRTWFKPSPPGGPFQTAVVNIIPGNVSERLFGLGQGEWSNDGSCPNGIDNGTVTVPLQRNGQSLNLQQRKFHVTIPFLTSTSGYGFLFNMPGFGSVSVGEFGIGGSNWIAAASAIGIDFWVTGLAAASTAAAAAANNGSSSNTSPSFPTPTTTSTSLASIYSQFADATGHAPPMREDALKFWQSRNRYKSSVIALNVATQYAALNLSQYVGLLVVDYENQLIDGDFNPNPSCYPSLSSLASDVRELLNATVMFSFWPEVQKNATTFSLFQNAGCLANSDLGGFAIDATVPSCRDLIWTEFLKPNYYDQGVSAYWLDETDGDGENGFDTSFGPAVAYSNLWVGSWISTFTQPVMDAGQFPPMVLTRGVWAGGARHGVVLWSSDIDSTFEQLTSMVPQGVHASMSGIPWWTTDVGGYGCGQTSPNNSTYMQELIVRWHEFGLFSSVYRTHGCREGTGEPDMSPCVGIKPSCGFNELWSYGPATQQALDVLVRFRSDTLLPYLRELSSNVSASGVPTMRPLWWEFPSDLACYDVNDQYLLGPSILVAPVTVQGARTRTIVFPAGATWVSVWNASISISGGVTVAVDAPLGQTPAYWRH